LVFLLVYHALVEISVRIGLIEKHLMLMLFILVSFCIFVPLSSYLLESRPVDVYHSFHYFLHWLLDDLLDSDRNLYLFDSLHKNRLFFLSGGLLELLDAVEHLWVI